MKKLICILFILVCFWGLTGCKEKELVDENIKLKAQVAVLEQQLKLCSEDLRNLKLPVDENKYDPSITNPNDNAGY